jgi:hypothetical protein
MEHNQPLFPVAEALAADLAGAQVDLNEAQKALAYLRAQKDGQALFTYLQAVVDHGNAVIRSRQTLAYYRDLRDACWRHLRPLQENYLQLVQTFAWSLRLARYYRAVPQDVQRAATGAGDPIPELDVARAAPRIPDLGETFTGPILNLDDDMVMVKVPGFPAERAIAVIQAAVGARPNYRIGNSARVIVEQMRTLRNGRVVLEVRPAPATPKPS